jgi:hypothetical protein
MVGVGIPTHTHLASKPYWENFFCGATDFPFSYFEDEDS